jgi:hypothetical protein
MEFVHHYKDLLVVQLEQCSAEINVFVKPLRRYEEEECAACVPFDGSHIRDELGAAGII